MDERMSAAEVIAASLNTEIVGHSGDYNGGRLTYSRSLDLAIQGLDALREAGWKLIHPESMTRVDIIGPGVKEFWADEWDALIQDDGATLKLFQVGDGAEAKAERNSHLVAEINANIAALAERASARESQDGDSDA